jgi:hypothetical protein
MGRCGMILFIPFASIAKLIADRSPRLKILSILLGEGEEDINKNTALNLLKVSLHMTPVLLCKKITSATLMFFFQYVCIFPHFGNYEDACFQGNVNTD